MAPSGVTNASLAGVCAAFAGICAKFALSPENPQVLVRILDAYIPPSYNAWVIRGFFAVATLTFNSLMLTLTAKALQLCPTTVQSVVTTSAVNFLVTVLINTSHL
ncbi:Transmembrane protein 42 [Daphnia sinensis]|uniref:Transmembrane protein 42 n=1 Tax=Daphnia sinensis TaxID=1820382 RepID=A0AAD5KI67_9CRUS|nr:Transmembrane protein 42 [Daphnia sinensis]